MTKPEGISNDESASAAWNSCFGFLSSFDIPISSFHFHPLPGLRRLHRSVRHGLRAHAIVKIRGACTLIADGVDEFKCLIVTEGHPWIALARIAHFPKLLGNGDRLQTGTARFAGLKLVPFASNEHERSLAAVDFHVIGAAPALVAAADEFAAFEHARRAALKFREDR